MNKAARGAANPDPKTKAPRKPGQPGVLAHTPTSKSRKRVRFLAGWGFTQEEIALLIDISEATLKLRYAPDLRVGMLECDEKVADRMMTIIEKGNDADAGRWGMFYFKVRRHWHEVQRIIHGFDPDTIKGFVKSVVIMLRRELPDKCPGCQTKLGLPEKVAQHMLQISQELTSKLPQSQIIPMPRPELASDGLNNEA